jgi:hypothetical protein
MLQQLDAELFKIKGGNKVSVSSKKKERAWKQKAIE